MHGGSGSTQGALSWYGRAKGTLEGVCAYRPPPEWAGVDGDDVRAGGETLLARQDQAFTTSTETGNSTSECNFTLTL